MINVLVTDGSQRAALTVVRSLGQRASMRVIVSNSSARSLASASRHCYRGVSAPDPLTDISNYAQAICDIVKREKIDVVFPITEPSIYLLNPVREDLPNNAKLACPSPAIMMAISDKSHLFKLAEEHNISIPQTFYLNDADSLSEIIGQVDRYPVVVKPALSRIQVDDGFLSGGVRYAKNQAELKYLYATSAVLRYPSMIQEKIVGPGTGLFTLYDKNRHLALFSHKRLREKPPSGGMSVVSESVPLDDEMVEAADKLLSAVDFEGVAMVEFKRDLRDGKAKLMEINGRFWGSLQLAVACGVDFPALYLDYLQGSFPERQIADYKVGHKLKWFLGTLDHLLIRLKNSNDVLNLPPGSPSKGRAVWEFIRLWEYNTTFDVFDLYDPAPFLFEARDYIKHAISAKS